MMVDTLNCGSNIPSLACMWTAPASTWPLASTSAVALLAYLAAALRRQPRWLAITLGIGWDGRRHVLSVELANRESASSWKDHLVRLKERGLHGVWLVASDDHPGLKRAIMETLPEAHWQRCYVHFLRNALDYLPRKADDDCLQELRWIYDRRDLQEANRDLAAWITKWQGKYPKLVDWVEGNIIETLTFYRLPRAHHKHLKSTNMLERLNEEIKRRTRVVRIFPNPASCLRLLPDGQVETQLRERLLRYNPAYRSSGGDPDAVVVTTRGVGNGLQ